MPSKKCRTPAKCCLQVATLRPCLRNTSFAQYVEILADVLRCDAGEFESPLLAPGEKAVDGSSVGRPSVFVADAAVVKLLGGEDGGLAGSMHDVRQGGYLGFGSQDESL